MNEHVDASELPELTDDDVRLLYHICERATESRDPPFKALFAAYDTVFAEQQVEPEHDEVVFRYLLRIGESTRAANRRRKAVDLVELLGQILEPQGITWEHISDDSGSVVEPFPARREAGRNAKRRVSFEDARLEETWLSAHSDRFYAPLQPPQSGLLALAPRRHGLNAPRRRARSSSPQHHVQNPAPKDLQQYSIEPTGEPDERFNPTLYFEPSQTQLEQNAEAFMSTSALRAARQAMHAWHDATLRLQEVRLQSYSLAAAHDRRILLKQAVDTWRAVLQGSHREKRRLEHLKRMEERVKRHRNAFLIHKSFTHWAISCEDERLRTHVAQRHMLKVRYFKKWKAIANENQIKVRGILVRKCLAIWRERTARRLLWQEQAVAHYEEMLMRKSKITWFWHFCSRRVEGWHEQWIQRRALSPLTRCLEQLQQQNRQAEAHFQSRSARRTLRALNHKLQYRRQNTAAAQQHHERIIKDSALHDLQIQRRLAPLARELTMKVNLDLKHKALKVWDLHLSLSSQAAEVDRQRILQSAWTNWNDALRCKALAQKIDERVLVENLYRWVLQGRLGLFQRTMDGRLLRRAMEWWLARVQQDRNRLIEAEVIFTERQRRRRLAFCMLRLNITMRIQEDAGRTAVEFANSHSRPKVLALFKDRANHASRLAKWAVDARFYCLCSTTLKIWHQKTNEHKQNRKRDAYVQVRGRVKIRIVGQCFSRWRNKTTEMQSMDQEAGQRAQASLASVGVAAFNRWRDESAHYVNLNAQGAEVNRQKLLGSALSAFLLKHRDLAGMDQQALDFKRETDLALLAGALRRVQWATFTAARKLESAEALLMRTRDHHVKQMLRHWLSQAAERRSAAQPDPTAVQEDGPESPTLMPASRTFSRSAPLALQSSPPSLATPGYMRTPSRLRRAGRFRPLPTPAPVTPMAFGSAYLATTPAPLQDTDLGETYHSFGDEVEGLTPQVTPFERKLRAGGFMTAPFSALKSNVFGKSVGAGGGGTNKSVRFAGSSRFGNRSSDDHEKSS